MPSVVTISIKEFTPVYFKMDTVPVTLPAELTAIAKIINDPVQTDALNRFAEGKLSYAEMRALCG